MSARRRHLLTAQSPIRAPQMSASQFRPPAPVWQTRVMKTAAASVSDDGATSALRSLGATGRNRCDPTFKRAAPLVGLFVHPNVFHSPVIVDAVDLRYDADHVRLPAGRATIMHDDRPRPILLQLAVDLPYQL